MVLSFQIPGTGYSQIAGTDAFIVPAGTGSNVYKTVLGMTRWNTTDGRLEIYDGSAWDTVAGSPGAVLHKQMHKTSYWS